MKYTPTPWKLCNDGNCPCLSIGGDGHPVADVTNGEWGDNIPVIRIEGTPGGCSGELKIKAEMSMIGYGTVDKKEAKANAEFIVRACNSHDQLVEALEVLLEHTKNNYTICGLNTQARQALAAAKEQA